MESMHPEFGANSSSGPGLVTVGVYNDLAEATVALSVLESVGIHAILCDVTVARLIRSPLGGIRLQVEEMDEQSASEVLAQSVPDSIAFDVGKSFEQPRCPACSSRRVSAASLLSGVPQPAHGDTWSCDACGALWEDSDD
jgi:hypothetical protein